MHEESERHREEILRQATRLFAEKGYASASIREMTGSTGFTRATLYYYFKAKRNLYLEVLYRCSETFQGAISSCYQPTALPSEWLRRVVETIIGFYRENSDQSRVLAEAMRSGEPDACGIAARCLQTAQSAIAQCIEKGVESGEFLRVDPSATSLAVVGAVASHIAWTGIAVEDETLGALSSKEVLDGLPELFVTLLSR